MGAELMFPLLSLARSAANFAIMCIGKYLENSDAKYSVHRAIYLAMDSD
jgi:hypothetical protein